MVMMIRGTRLEAGQSLHQIRISALLLALVLMASLMLTVDKLGAEGAVSAADPQPTPLYRLPWTGGERYPVTQDWNKHFDFRLPAGTRVRAARGGTVYVKRASVDNGCCDPSCSIYDNYVRIMHDDGSYGFYQHLQFGSITVNTGDVVAQGDCLGLSGATGYVCGLTGEHLHFNVSTDPFNSGGTPYGSAFVEVAFVEGAIPTGDAYTPHSQNSRAPCGSGAAPTATPTPTPGPTTTPGSRLWRYLPLAVRRGR